MLSCFDMCHRFVMSLRPQSLCCDANNQLFNQKFLIWHTRLQQEHMMICPHQFKGGCHIVWRQSSQF